MSDADDRSIARRTLIVIGLVLATLVALALVWATRLVLTWILVAAFFAVALKPLVDVVERRLVRRRAGHRGGARVPDGAGGAADHRPDTGAVRRRAGGAAAPDRSGVLPHHH